MESARVVVPALGVGQAAVALAVVAAQVAAAVALVEVAAAQAEVGVPAAAEVVVLAAAEAAAGRVDRNDRDRMHCNPGATLQLAPVVRGLEQVARESP